MDLQGQPRFARRQVKPIDQLPGTPATCHTDIDDGNASDVQASEDATPRLARNAAIKAHEHMKNWTNTLSVAPEDVKDL